MGVVVGDAPHVDSEADQVQLRLRQLRGEKGGAQPVREREALEEEETQADLPTLAQQIRFAENSSPDKILGSQY